MARPCDGLTPVELQELPLCDEQAERVGSRLRELFGEVSQWNNTLLQHVGALAVTLAPADMGQLANDQLTAVAELGCLGAPLVECIVKRAKHVFADGEGLGAWGAQQLRDLGSAVTGLDASSLRDISSQAVRDAIADLAPMQWNADQLAAIADQLVAALGGSASTWSAADVAAAGAVLAGMDDDALAALRPALLSEVGAEALAALCSNNKLHVLTADQLRELARVHTSFSCAGGEALFTSVQRSAVQKGQADGDGGNSSGSNGVAAGTVAAAVIVPIVLIVLIALGVVLYRKRSVPSFALLFVFVVCVSVWVCE